MERRTYDDGRSLVVPSSLLEIGVLRHSIMGDRFVLDPEFPHALRRLPILNGGRLFRDPDWSADLVMYYALGEHLGGGAFELTAEFFNARTCKSLGKLELAGALGSSRLPHDIQMPGIKEFLARRSMFFHPVWFFVPGQQPSADLQIKTHEEVPCRLLVFDDIHFHPNEYRTHLPHAVLVDPASLNALE